MDRGPLINPDLLIDDPFRLTPPDPVPCPFCGRLLAYISLCNAQGEHTCWSLVPEACTCEGYTRDLERMADENRQWKEREKRRQTDEMYERLLSETLYGSGLAGRDQRTFDGYQPGNAMQELAMDRVERYVAEFPAMRQTGTGLLLSGPNGTGKTHLATACVLKLHRAGYRGLMYRAAAEIMTELHSAWDRRISETALMRAYTTAPLLVIDDIGKQGRTDSVQRCMYEILDGRYSRHLPTILTTNAAPSALASCIGTDRDVTDAVVSRLMETMVCVPVTGSDYRKRRNIRRTVHRQDGMIPA